MRYEGNHKKDGLKWIGHAWKKNNIMIKSVIKEDPIGKKPIRRSRLRWEDCVKSDVKTVDPRAN